MCVHCVCSCLVHWLVNWQRSATTDTVSEVHHTGDVYFPHPNPALLCVWQGEARGGAGVLHDQEVQPSGQQGAPQGLHAQRPAQPAPPAAALATRTVWTGTARHWQGPHSADSAQGQRGQRSQWLKWNDASKRSAERPEVSVVKVKQWWQLTLRRVIFCTLFHSSVLDWRKS